MRQLTDHRIWLLYDSKDDLYWTGKHRDWGPIEKSLVWHREVDAKKAHKKALAMFSWRLEDVQRRAALYSHMHPIMEELKERHERSLLLDQGLRIIKMRMEPVS